MSAWLITTIMVALVVFAYIAISYKKIYALPEGTDQMKKMSGIIRDGANTFMKTEYKTIAIVVAVLAIVFSLFIEKTSGITFLIGAAMSSLVCIIGMKSATYANVRTANRANTSRSVFETVKVALTGGSISGLGVQAFGIFGLVMVVALFGGIDPEATSHGFLVNLACNPTIMRISTYGLGCSTVAMFNRVAGGNYTKAADISSDMVGKHDFGLPEDDARIPSTIADFIGDNVNDIAGNCSDLLESFVATVVASIMIAVAVFKANPDFTASTLNATVSYPIALAAVGLVSCLIGIVATTKVKFSDDPSKQLNMATYISAGMTIVLGLIGAKVIFGNAELYGSFSLGWISPWVSAILGIASGVAIGVITEYYTSAKYKYVKSLAHTATEGTSFLITEGDALGSRSCIIPVLLIGISLLISSKVCGNYGIAISALGMLSFVGTTVSIDAFGPIADNAGGLAESCHLDEGVRTITDELDSVGNTTAAIGKGFAIGSAAFATVSLIMSYVASYNAGAVEPVLNIASAVVVVGGMIGGALVEFFSALLTINTKKSADKMRDESLRQLKIPGVIEGTVTPDYERCIKMAADEALKKMLLPSVLALLVPIIGGFLVGVEFVGGVLIGATIVAIPRAIFMGNSGGAFDNAKKAVEAGEVEGHGKGSEAHKTAVEGDTVGDTRKDVVGVALDIFIKMMSTVANTLAPIFASIR